MCLKCHMIILSFELKQFLMAFMTTFSKADASYQQPTDLHEKKNFAKMLHFR